MSNPYTKLATEFDEWAQNNRAESMANGHWDVTMQMLDDLELRSMYNSIDVGCGNGWLVRELLNRGVRTAVGLDISPEMIKVAKDKKIYRNLYEIDLTKPIDNVPNNYSGIISAGVFTHGHLGPEVIKKLLSICLDGAILTIGINAAYYENKKFEDFIINLESSAEIKEINKIKIPIYADRNNLEKKVNNMAIICSFIKN